MEEKSPLRSLAVSLCVLWMLGDFAGGPLEAASSVRFKLRENDRIVVPVLVNGAGPFDFVLDTGAQSTLIDLKLARKLSLRLGERLRLTTFTGTQEVPIAYVQSLALGPKSKENLRVLCVDLQRLFSLNSRILGVLGQNFLSQFNYLLSYQDKSIGFEEGGDLQGQLLGTPHPIERKHQKIYVRTQPASPQKRSLRFLLDSGASHTVLFETPSQKLDLDIVETEGQELIASTHIGRRKLRPCRLRSIQIGTETFRYLPARLTPTLATETRWENGLFPTCLFQAIYFNNTEDFVILNPRLAK